MPTWIDDEILEQLSGRQLRKSTLPCLDKSDCLTSPPLLELLAVFMLRGGYGSVITRIAVRIVLSWMQLLQLVVQLRETEGACTRARRICATVERYSGLGIG